MTTISKQQAVTIAANAKYDIALSALNLPANEFSFLTPEALMAFCETKIRGIDAQVQSAFLKQKARNDLSDKLSRLANLLSPKSGNDSGGVKAEDTQLKADIVAAFDDAIRAAGGDTGLAERLTQQKATFAASAVGGSKDNDGDVADWEIKAILDTVQSIQSDTNRAGELEMIQLQSLMSMRQQALQLCTNMVQSCGQMTLGIVQKIGQ